MSGSGGGGAAPQLPGLIPPNLACLRALVAAALFLAGTLGSSWFAVFEALHADYVPTTRGTAPPGPEPLRIGTVAGTSSRCGGTTIEGQVEQQQQKDQAATHPLADGDVDFEHQAAI